MLNMTRRTTAHHQLCGSPVTIAERSALTTRTSVSLGTPLLLNHGNAETLHVDICGIPDEGYGDTNDELSYDPRLWSCPVIPLFARSLACLVNNTTTGPFPWPLH